MSVARRLLILVIGCAVALFASGAAGATASFTPVDRVDLDAIAASITPGANRVAGEEGLFLSGVNVPIVQPDGERSTFVVGVYRDPDSARKALRRTMPSAPIVLDGEIGSEHFLSSRFLHLRIENVCLLVDRGAALDSSGLLRLGRELERIVLVVSESTKPAPVPVVEVVRAARSADGSLTVDYRVDHQGQVLTPASDQSRDDVFRASRSKRSADPEFTLRVGSTDGLIVEVVESDFPASAWNAPDKWADEAQSDRVAIEAAIERVRAGAESGKVHSQHVLELSRIRDDSVVPVLEELLGGDHPGPIKKFALKGIEGNRGAEAIDVYRRLAASPDEPGVVRRNAIRLIEQFGNAEDVALLEAIVREADETTLAAADAAKRAVSDR